MDVVKRKVYEFLYKQLEKKARNSTKIYAFYPFCENSERLSAFNSFWQKKSKLLHRCSGGF